MAYLFVTDLLRQVRNILQPAHGGTGDTYGRERVAVRGINTTGADLPLWTLVRMQAGANTPTPKVIAVDALDSESVLGVVVGYFDGSEFVEDDAPDHYEVAVLTMGIVRILIESAVTRGEYAYAAATDGTIYSSSTLTTGAFGRIVTSADTGNGDTYAWVMLPITNGGGGGGGGGGSFGTPALTLSTSNAGGSASTGIRTDATIALFDTTDPTDVDETAADDGSTAKAARRDHRHKLKAKGGIDIITTSPGTGVTVDIEMPFAGTWTSWRVFNDVAGSIQYDLWLDSYTNFPPTIADTITASDKPKTTSAAKAESAASPPTGWTTAFAAGDILRVNIDSTSGGVGRSVLSLRYTRT